jgi:hypothetical protein
LHRWGEGKEVWGEGKEVWGEGKEVMKKKRGIGNGKRENQGYKEGKNEHSYQNQRRL